MSSTACAAVCGFAICLDATGRSDNTHTILRPLVIAHHLIFTVYGRWLPNDPRGSSSHEIRNTILAGLGELHFGRKLDQPDGRIIREFYREADKRLAHEAMEFDADDRSLVADSFAQAIEDERFTCWACAIMDDHVHLVMRKHKYQAEEMIGLLQETSRSRLREAGKRHEDHPVWGGPGWVVFLDHPDAVRRTIAYVERNPHERAWPPQQWAFVKPYDNWPLHEGHSPNSPYAKRLRALGRYP